MKSIRGTILPRILIWILFECDFLNFSIRKNDYKVNFTIVVRKQYFFILFICGPSCQLPNQQTNVNKNVCQSVNKLIEKNNNTTTRIITTKSGVWKCLRDKVCNSHVFLNVRNASMNGLRMSLAQIWSWARYRQMAPFHNKDKPFYPISQQWHASRF